MRVPEEIEKRSSSGDQQVKIAVSLTVLVDEHLAAVCPHWPQIIQIGGPFRDFGGATVAETRGCST
jgi:hypothetical protein